MPLKVFFPAPIHLPSKVYSNGLQTTQTFYIKLLLSTTTINSGQASQRCDLCSCSGLCSERLTRVLTLFGGLLEVLANFWTRGSHFHSTLGPTNHIADSVPMTVFEQESWKTYNKEGNAGTFVPLVSIGQYGNK